MQPKMLEFSVCTNIRGPFIFFFVIKSVYLQTIKLANNYGEVIHINTKFDFDELKMRHSDLTEEQISNFLPSE